MEAICSRSASKSKTDYSTYCVPLVFTDQKALPYSTQKLYESLDLSFFIYYKPHVTGASGDHRDRLGSVYWTSLCLRISRGVYNQSKSRK